MTVGQPGGRILPVGPGMGATQAGCKVMSPTRAAGRPPIITVAEPFPIMPGPPGTQPGSVHGAVTRGRLPVSDVIYLAVAVGFIGTYTTFSTFMLESSRQLEDGSGIKAILNLMGSILVGLLAVRVGMALAARG